MPLYGGIDLHANNSVVVLLNEQAQVIYQRRLANHLPEILESFAPYQADITGVVVESTYNESPLKKALEFPILSNISTSCMDLSMASVWPLKVPRPILT